MGWGPSRVPHHSSPSLPRSGPPCKSPTSTSCLCSTGSVVALAPSPCSLGQQLQTLSPLSPLSPGWLLSSVLPSSGTATCPGKRIGCELCPIPVPGCALPDPTAALSPRGGHTRPWAGSWHQPSCSFLRGAPSPVATARGEDGAEAGLDLPWPCSAHEAPLPLCSTLPQPLPAQGVLLPQVSL